MKLLHKINNLILLATYNSKNSKTGPMVQTWILDEDNHPHSAYKAGLDTAVCLQCIRRSKASGGTGNCYVQTAYAPSSIWRSYVRHRHQLIKEWEIRKSLKDIDIGESVRIGAYGEPTLFPFEVWNEYLKGKKMWTGYTHQWKTCDPRFKQYLMASVDNEQEYWQANEYGWRTYRVSKDGKRFRYEAYCPSANSPKGKVMCITCPASIRCNGYPNPTYKTYNVTIKEH